MLDEVVVVLVEEEVAVTVQVTTVTTDEEVDMCCPETIRSSPTTRVSSPVISWSSQVISTLPVATETSDQVATTFTCCKTKWVQNVVLENVLISTISALAAVGLMRR